MFRTEEASSADVRVPEVPAGTAVVVTQYGRRVKAVVVNPDDFARMQRMQALVEDASRLDPVVLSALAAELHAGGEAGEELDHDSLGAALGLS